MVRYLISAGADTEARTAYKMTPLHVAAFYGSAAVMRLLLEEVQDLDIDALDFGSCKLVLFFYVSTPFKFWVYFVWYTFRSNRFPSLRFRVFDWAAVSEERVGVPCVCPPSRPEHRLQGLKRTHTTSSLDPGPNPTSCLFISCCSATCVYFFISYVHTAIF